MKDEVDFDAVLGELERKNIIKMEGDHIALTGYGQECAASLKRAMEDVENRMDACLDILTEVAKLGRPACFSGDMAYNIFVKCTNADKQAAGVYIELAIAKKSQCLDYNTVDGMFRGTILSIIEERKILNDVPGAYEIARNRVEQLGYV